MNYGVVTNRGNDMNHAQTKAAIADMFRDWFNNFLTVACFADYYGISESRAERIIDTGRKIHNNDCELEADDYYVKHGA